MIAWDKILEIPGYTPESELYTLFLVAALTSNLPGDIIEIGSWCGRSSLILAAMSGNSKVHCIDLFLDRKDWHQNWDGTWSSRTLLPNSMLFNSHTNPPVPDSVFNNEVLPIYAEHDCIFDYFCSNVDIAQGVVIPHKGTSETWKNSVPPDFKCRLAFIDGGHSYEEVAEDIKNIESFIVPGGYVLFDDVAAGFPGVDQAVKEMIMDNPRYDNLQHVLGRLLIARRTHA